jgi:hypothetical protein
MLVGIGGERKVGKDTSSEILIKRYGFTQLSFAGPLKEMCSEVFQLPLEYFNNQEYKERPFETPVKVTKDNLLDMIDIAAEYHNFDVVQANRMIDAGMGLILDTPRKLLQTIGTDLVRKHIKDTFWTDVMEQEIKVHENSVITDVRFPNERIFVRNNEGLLLLVERESEGKKVDAHSSENSIGSVDEYDYVIKNNKSVADLHDVVEAIYLLDLSVRKGMVS